MTDRASWRNTSGFGILWIAVSAVLIAGGSLKMSPALILAGTVPLVYLYMIGHRLSAHLDEERIGYRGWITASEARWDEVVSVTRMSDLSSPRRFYYGPLCYEVRTKETEFIVNLLYFSPAFGRAFTGAVKQRRLLNKRART